MSSSPMRPCRKFLVTSALPYANSDIHLGHLVEAVQTDVFVRYQRLRGNTAVYVCADDTHGTPIEISALKRGITPEELIAETWQNHARDYAAYSISFDIFYTTNSPENKRYAELVYQKLREKGLVVEKEIEQFFDEKEKRFLPDRFIKGTCPRCCAEDQYGDVCEACGAAYDPTEIKSPRSVLSDTTPVLRRSTHFFVQLSKCETFLREYLTSARVLQEDMRSFVLHFIESGLREWCISRDGPYFGFAIPGAANKFFYVWLDAPIGYLSSTDKWCADHGQKVEDYWGESADCELVHFIGKDIVYFHTLFWPVMLNAAGFKLPSRIFVHGFLNMQQEKMSKSRGTFILAREYREKMAHPNACDYLRFYFAAKLGSAMSDIDLDIGEFCNRVNTTLVNNIGNLHHRTCVFLDRYFGSMVPDQPWDASISSAVDAAAKDIAELYANADYKVVVEKVQALGNMGNKYYQDAKPWELMKTDPAKAGTVMVTCLNLVKALAVFLKPIVPNLIAAIEQQLSATLAWEDHRFSLRGVKLGETKKLVIPINRSDFAALVGEEAPAADAAPSPVVSEDGLIDISEFSRVDLRVATIKEAEPVASANKLLRLVIDTGSGTRQIVAGIAQSYAPASLVGMQIVFVANLKPAMLRGLKSEGMLLAAKQGNKLVLVRPETEIAPGAKVS
jgi:methionyl-tRNA synthetase